MNALRKQLEFYESLLKILEECEASVTSSLLEEIRNEEGEIIARIYQGKGIVKMVLTSPVDASNPYIRFLSRKFNKLIEEGVDIEFEFEKTEDGKIQAVIVKGAIDSEELLDSILRTLRFAALKIARSTT